MTELRGTGLTTRQIASAPPEALYVWPNHHFGYVQNLARKMGRQDLQIVSPLYLERARIAGLRKQIVVDHATQLSAGQLHLLLELRR